MNWKRTLESSDTIIFHEVLQDSSPSAVEEPAVCYFEKNRGKGGKERKRREKIDCKRKRGERNIYLEVFSKVKYSTILFVDFNKEQRSWLNFEMRTVGVSKLAASTTMNFNQCVERVVKSTWM